MTCHSSTREVQREPCCPVCKNCPCFRCIMPFRWNPQTQRTEMVGTNKGCNKIFGISFLGEGEVSPSSRNRNFHFIFKEHPVFSKLRRNQYLFTGFWLLKTKCWIFPNTLSLQSVKYVSPNASIVLWNCEMMCWWQFTNETRKTYFTGLFTLYHTVFYQTQAQIHTWNFIKETIFLPCLLNMFINIPFNDPILIKWSQNFS